MLDTLKKIPLIGWLIAIIAALLGFIALWFKMSEDGKVDTLVKNAELKGEQKNVDKQIQEKTKELKDIKPEEKKPTEVVDYWNKEL